MSALIRRLGVVPYVPTWERMRAFVAARTDETADEIWFLEHPPVYTLGLAGDPAHVLDPGAIPVIRTDRGGQVTYHGPGQLVAYVLADLKRLAIGPRELVRRLEEAVIQFLAAERIEGERRPKAPGVYVGGSKIAALGLRIRKGCSYHGLALNVAPDLEPFGRINPCGYAGLVVTSLARLGRTLTVDAAGSALEPLLLTALYGGRTSAKSLGDADNVLPSHCANHQETNAA